MTLHPCDRHTGRLEQIQVSFISHWGKFPAKIMQGLSSTASSLSLTFLPSVTPAARGPCHGLRVLGLVPQASSWKRGRPSSQWEGGWRGPWGACSSDHNALC